MATQRWNNLAVLVVGLVLLGSGCLSIEPQSQTSEEAAQSLSFVSGSSFRVRETVLGLGGKVATLFGQSDVERTVDIQKWEAGKQAVLHWSREFKEETEASKKARLDYQALYVSAPVGATLPTSPEPQYKKTVEQGTLETQALADASKVLLPLFWAKDQTQGDDTSLLWLSRKQYDELVNTRKTKVNLGLFDDSISYAMSLTDQVKYFVDRIKGSQDQPQQEDVLQIDAKIDWATYALSVNGVNTAVRAISAQNAFARYTILANPDNPLILSVMLSPASRGSLNLFSKQAIGEAFWGYEITGVTLADAEPSADQLQP
ncbi:hypothetical protein HZA85_03695 [Candidatus Uhrbacteria bacterium]|nr:hypothetical protein [Candidatus Uhrbacteria bacterium]